MRTIARKTFFASPRVMLATALALIVCGLAVAGPAQAQYRREITNNMTRCHAGSASAVMVTVTGVRASAGTLRVQTYRGTEGDWLQKGRWLNRIEVPARAGTMTFCLPVPGPGSYAVAVRHDIDNSGKTNLREDGGGMSNNPSINIFNLGKPSVRRTAFQVGNDVKSIGIAMRYM